MKTDRTMPPTVDLPPSKFLDRHGLRYAYIDEGRGPAIICVHGNPTWSYYFRRVIAEFSTTHRVIAPDHIGCGRSDKPGDDRYDYRLQSRVDDLEALIEHLDVGDDITLVLHDWGGMIGMALACRMPQRIKRLVILNTAGFLLPAGRELPWRLRLIRNTGPLGALIVRGCNGFAWPATWMAVSRPLPPEVKAAYLSPYDTWANRIATLRFVQDIPLEPGDPSYALAKSTDDRISDFADRPALICWGSRDFVFNEHFLGEWKRRLPDAETHVFADANHYVLEDAHERILPLIRAFLERS